MKGQAVLPQLLVDPPGRALLDRAYCGPDDGPVFEDSTDDWAAARTLCSRCQVVDRAWCGRCEQKSNTSSLVGSPRTNAASPAGGAPAPELRPELPA